MELLSTGNPDIRNPVAMSMLEYLAKRGSESMNGIYKYPESICPHMTVLKGKSSDYELHLTEEEIYEKVEREKRIEYIEQFCRLGRRNLHKLSDGELLAVIEIFKQYE